MWLTGFTIVNNDLFSSNLVLLLLHVYPTVNGTPSVVNGNPAVNGNEGVVNGTPSVVNGTPAINGSEFVVL